MNLTKEDLAAIGIMISENNSVLEARFEQKLELKLEEKIAPLRIDIQFIKYQLEVIKLDIIGLKSDVVALKKEVFHS